MRKAWTFVAMAAIAVSALAADQNRERGRDAANQVRDKFGKSDSFSSEVLQPMTTNKPLKSVDGQRSVDARIGCEGTNTVVGVTLAPTASNDISSLVVQVDSNVDGSVDQVRSFNGPFGAVCVNGVVQCPAGGTGAGCTYYRWDAQGSGVTLTAVPQEGLSACYCFNSACGSNLLTVNSKKVGEDIAVGVGTALVKAHPNIALGEAKQVDAVNTLLYGQLSNCSTANGPEQYSANISGAVAAGQSVTSSPNSAYGKLLSTKSGINADTCTISRDVKIQSKPAGTALTVGSQTSGTVVSCGTNCYTVTIGNTGNDDLKGGNCNIHVDNTVLNIADPSAIESAVLNSVSFDDQVHVSVGGVKVFNTDPAWDGNSPHCGENRDRGTVTPNLDITAQLKAAAASGAATIRVATGWDDGGDRLLKFTIRVKDYCGDATDSVVNGCTAFENNSDCRIDTESVDGVTTVSNFYATNATVPPSTKTVVTGSCNKQVEKAWWTKTRKYQCQAQASTYDYSTAVNRYNSVHKTFDTKTGAYTDLQKHGSSVSTVPSKIDALPEPDPVQQCFPTCKTRRLRPGANVGLSGGTTQQNATGVPYDYNFKECTANVCPLDPGEEVVSACACQNAFGEAAAIMQTIRQVGQDAVCTAK